MALLVDESIGPRSEEYVNSGDAGSVCGDRKPRSFLLSMLREEEVTVSRTCWGS